MSNERLSKLTLHHLPDKSIDIEEVSDKFSPRIDFQTLDFNYQQLIHLSYLYKLINLNQLINC